MAGTFALSYTHRAKRAGYQATIASEDVASGQKSFSDALRFWKESFRHRKNLLRPNVTAAGVAMAKNKSGRAYWTLVLGADRPACLRLALSENRSCHGSSRRLSTAASLTATLRRSPQENGYGPRQGSICPAGGASTNTRKGWRVQSAKNAEL